LRKTKERKVEEKKLEKREGKKKRKEEKKKKKLPPKDGKNVKRVHKVRQIETPPQIQGKQLGIVVREAGIEASGDRGEKHQKKLATVEGGKQERKPKINPLLEKEAAPKKNNAS